MTQFFSPTDLLPSSGATASLTTRMTRKPKAAWAPLPSATSPVMKTPRRRTRAIEGGRFALGRRGASPWRRGGGGRLKPGRKTRRTRLPAARSRTLKRWTRRPSRTSSTATRPRRQVEKSRRAKKVVFFRLALTCGCLLPHVSVVFHNEVLDSLQRGVLQNLSPENLVVEINSSRHAYNETW